jgi:hypothetical protein
MRRRGRPESRISGEAAASFAEIAARIRRSGWLAGEVNGGSAEG